MKQLRIVIAMTIIALLFGLTGVVYAENGPESVNTFSVSPDPQTAGSDVTLSINVDIADGDSDDVTYICIYEPNTNSAVDEPDSFTLTYYSGFSSNDVIFNETTQPDGGVECPSRTGQTSTLYKADTSGSLALPDTETTYDGSTSWPLASGASAGSYDWTLLLSEPGGTPNPLSYNHEVQEAPTTIYASDQSDCGGYGIAGTSCFQSLQDAVNATTATADEVVIIGTLTDDGATVSSGDSVNTIRGDSAPLLNAASGCTAAITDTKGITIRDFTIDGTNCSDGTGIAIIASGAAVDNMTIRDFINGTGIQFANGGAGTVKNCVNSINNNGTGIDIQSDAGAVNVGTGPADGNSFTDNDIGISVNNGNANIVDNSISGGTIGIEVNADAQVYGNNVTGASDNQIYCQTASWASAGWNYLGGISPSAGTNCDSPEYQLGAPIAGWDDDGTYGGASDNNNGGLVFQLSSTPYGVDAPGSAVFAISGGTDVIVPGSNTQYKMFMDGTDGAGTDVCLGTMTSACWEADDGSTPRSQDGPGYFSNSSSDPTAITFTTLSASSNTWLPVGILTGISLLTLGALVILRKRA
jgi:hypothetical protein